ncbi:F0F1 ATP synthase subunit epsilon [Limimaricola cinnabarinus]|uniref:F0F1 ATP synthase subunit epsilon n=1 Tax=Limimaricola cinnabarinus TaxID=1125964 RepID=UPI002FDFF95C
MADTLQFDLVSPERKLASVSATEVRIPGTDGDLTAMAGHTPTITTLRPGLLQVVHQGGTDDYVISGGFAEIGPDSVSVLAERAHPRGEVTQEIYEGMVEEFASAHRDAQAKFENEPGPVDDTAKLLADMVAVGTHIGLDPKQPNF